MAIATKTTPPQRKLEGTRKALPQHAVPAHAPEKKSRRAWVITAAAVTLLAVIFTTVRLKHVTVPPELIGTWKSTSPDYKDRDLEIGGESISFSTGGGTEYTGFIDHIDADTDKNGMFYTFYYLVDGNKNQISFYYNTADGGSIQLKNQPNILWKKESAS